MKKKTAKTAGEQRDAFHIYSAGEPADRKGRLAAFLTDLTFLWLYLAGTALWLGAAFRLDMPWGVLLPGQGVLAALLLAVCGRPGKRRAIGLTAWCGALAAAAALLSELWGGGLHLLMNHIVDVVGEKFPYLLPAYEVSLAKSLEPMALMTAFLWLTALAAPAALYLVRRGSRFLLGVHVVLLLTVRIVLGAPQNLLWMILPLLCLLAVWMRGHGEKVQAGRQRLASLELFGVTAVASAVLLAGGGLLLRQFSSEDSLLSFEWKESLKDQAEALRYEGGSDVLPDGDFRGIGSFEPQGEPVLEVTMSQPESYYLRGFTGSVYTGAGWEGLAAETLWENRDLFFWLHADGFYGQEELGTAAVSLDEAVVAEEKNRISVRNLAGNSRYYYVPYELRTSAGEELRTALDSQKIGDEGLLAGGLFGNREYSYGALSNQVTNYPAYAARLLDTDNLTEREKAYQEREEYYNEFVYSEYLEIPGQLRTYLYELLGPAETVEGEKHSDYAQAKQNILYALTASCTNTNELGSPWDGADFIYEFLEGTKKGYSVHFASAAAMMFRYYGIPARYVEGYLITPEDAASMTAGEPYVLDDTHAHVWVEYYQDGVGWLPFETTPSYLNTMERADDFQDISGMAGSGSGDNSDEQDQIQEDQEEEENEEEEPEIDWIFVLMVIMSIAIVLLLLLISCFTVWVLLQRRKSRKAKKLFESSDRRAAVRALFDYSMNLLSVGGLPIRNISLYRYRRPVRELFGEELSEAYRAAADIRQEAVYSAHEITEEQKRRMEEFKDTLWERVYKDGGLFQRFQLKYIYFL